MQNERLLIGIVAGEPSGDILGAGLITALKRFYPNAEFVGIGGTKMQQAGCYSLFPLEKLSVMGLFEIIKHLPEILSIRSGLIRFFTKNKPDLFIGIDAPEFNLSVEKALKKRGISTVHYTSPSVWAWRENRVHTIAKATDLMLTLLPFEAAFYEKYNIPVRFVGHPLADQIPTETDPLIARKKLGLPQKAKIIAMLPGSRQNEIAKIAPVFLQAAMKLWQEDSTYTFVAPMVDEKKYRLFLKLVRKYAPQLPLKIIQGQSHTVIEASDVVMVASGTATLEALLLKKPMVVGYKVSPLTYWLGKKLVKIDRFALPNLLADKALVPEYIQESLTAEAVKQAVSEYFEITEKSQWMIGHYQHIHLGLRRDASERAAEAVMQLLNLRKHHEEMVV